VDHNGAHLSDNALKANAFNKFFVSVGTPDNNIIPECHEDTLLTSILEYIVVDAADVMSSIDKLKSNNCSSGPDGLPPILFNRLKHCLCYPLALLYNQMLSVGYVPRDWLAAHIIPVHKKGITNDVSNYRPISLTCVMSKILERIIVGRIADHFHNNNILHPAQHGFVKYRSTTKNLLESYNDWSISIQSRKQISIVYIDFTKAFDLVSHQTLFVKLHAYGVRGNVLKWLQNFFSGRAIQTKTDSSFSDIADLISGVVQGCGIGPLMFFTYINGLVDILEQHNIKVKLFADDLKIYITIVDDTDVQRTPHCGTQFSYRVTLYCTRHRCC